MEMEIEMEVEVEVEDFTLLVGFHFSFQQPSRIHAFG
jgi:hypothetical protein